MAGPTLQTPNDLMVVFSTTITEGFDALSGPVSGIFGMMIVLVVALTGIQWALSSQREMLAAGFGKVLLIGAFAWLINDWQALSETIYAGFIELGLTAGGGSLSRAEFLNPGAVLAQGWEIVRALGETPAPVDNPLDVAGNLADALILSLAMIGIMLAFAVLALQIIVSLIEFKIVTLGGFVLLPFGIWSRSAFLAERPLGYVVSSGLKVLALALVVSGARSVFDQLQPSANPDLYEALTILVASLLLAMLAVFIPNLAGALVTGGPALGAGAAMGGVLAVGGTAAAGAGLITATAGRLSRAGALLGPSRAAAGAQAPPRSAGPGPFGPRPGSQGAGPDAPPPPASPPGPGRPPSGGGQLRRSPPGFPQTRATAAPDPWSQGAGPAGASSEPSASRPGRAGALRAYLAANSARSLMPAVESSGTLQPQLRPRED
ncbi:MAG: type IV secretion system protein TrbL [Brevundimonas sp.]|jgi:type IV secretion system protein TrbL|uniref:P-type conjugative transfer protein TrbL n=1 Tax=Brevundimonas sp. TaxID=1871086 RepID=UPI0039E2D5F7